MFVERHENGTVKNLTSLTKIILTVLTLISLVSGGLFFMEDRYFNTADAKDMQEKLEFDAVKTFQMQQRILKTEQEGLERKWDTQHLQDLRDHKLFLKKELDRDNHNELLEERLEIIENQIEKLENKLYN